MPPFTISLLLPLLLCSRLLRRRSPNHHHRPLTPARVEAKMKTKQIWSSSFCSFLWPKHICVSHFAPYHFCGLVLWKGTRSRRRWGLCELNIQCRYVIQPDFMVIFPHRIQLLKQHVWLFFASLNNWFFAIVNEVVVIRIVLGWVHLFRRFKSRNYLQESREYICG